MKYGRMSDVDDGDNGTTIYEVWEMSDVDDGGDGTTISEVWGVWYEMTVKVVVLRW
jgi:hypothetical protein